MEKKFCIYGAGGSGREVLMYLIELNSFPKDQIGENIVFMVDDDYYKRDEVLGVSIIKRSKIKLEEYKVIVAVGDPTLRYSMVQSLSANVEYFTLIHPTAIISEWVEIGMGSIIAAGSILTTNISLGKHSHINLNTSISHDCIVGDFFTSAPGVNISGNVTIGNRCSVGINAAIKNRINICDDVVIGMGAVVVKDIDSAGVYIGNPAKKLER